MHKKVYLTAGLLLIVISLLLYMLHAVDGSIAMLKCLTRAYGVMLLSRGCMELLHVRKRNYAWLYGTSVLLMGCYTLLAADTYLFHVLHWFPGIIRYPIFSLYGISYLLFILPGVMLHIGSDSNEI